SLSIGEPLTISGTGISTTGAIRNLDATGTNNNTITGAVTLGATASVLSDADTITFDTSSGSAFGAGVSTSYGLTLAGAGNITVSDPIATPITTLTKQGAGTLTLSAANTYTGATTVSAGTLAASNATSLGSTAGTTEIADGAVLSLSGTYTTFAETLTISGTGGGSGVIRSTSGNKTLTGAITLGASATIQADADTLTFSNTLTTASGRHLTTTGSGNVLFDGKVTGAGNVVKSGSGTLTLASTSNDFGGTTTVSAGSLKLGGTGVIPDGSAVSVALGATFNMMGQAETIGSLAGAGAVTLSAILTTGGNNSSTTYSGATSGGSGSITKQGSGTMTLSGTNEHTGGVTVSAGVLEVSADANLGTVPSPAAADKVVINGGTLSVTTGFTL
ncbi:MAG: transporter, partial [Chitinophagales bacterium]|nr:transporter [Chitinophagales bacterium]